jgi:hypothetical protein
MNPLAFEVFAPYDDLIEMASDLEAMTDIDARTYAAACFQLSNMFEAAGLLTNAAKWEERGNRYAE